MRTGRTIFWIILFGGLVALADGPKGVSERASERAKERASERAKEKALSEQKNEQRKTCLQHYIKKKSLKTTLLDEELDQILQSLNGGPNVLSSEEVDSLLNQIESQIGFSKTSESLVRIERIAKLLQRSQNPRVLFERTRAYKMIVRKKLSLAQGEK